jgi:hypothetical protein
MVRDCVWVCAVGVFDGREGGYSFVRLVDEDVRYVPPRETLIEGHSVESTRLLALPPQGRICASFLRDPDQKHYAHCPRVPSPIPKLQLLAQVTQTEPSTTTSTPEKPP